MARRAADTGIETMVATPHIRADFPFDPREIDPAVKALRGALRDAEVPLRVLAGAEVALTSVVDLDDDLLRRLCLGEGPYLLVELPYSGPAVGFEEIVFNLQLRGFRPVLAHPERCSAFTGDRGRLETVVGRGVLCSITAASLAGQFGGSTRRFALELLRAGLVHNIASDAHDPTHRAPDLGPGLRDAGGELKGFTPHAQWLTVEVPRAVVEDRPLPARPELGARGRDRGPAGSRGRRRFSLSRR